MLRRSNIPLTQQNTLISCFGLFFSIYLSLAVSAWRSNMSIMPRLYHASYPWKIFYINNNTIFSINMKLTYLDEMKLTKFILSFEVSFEKGLTWSKYYQNVPQCDSLPEREQCPAWRWRRGPWGRPRGGWRNKRSRKRSIASTTRRRRAHCRRTCRREPDGWCSITSGGGGSRSPWTCGLFSPRKISINFYLTVNLSDTIKWFKKFNNLLSLITKQRLQKLSRVVFII